MFDYKLGALGEYEGEQMNILEIEEGCDMCGAAILVLTQSNMSYKHFFLNCEGRLGLLLHSNPCGVGKY